MQLTALNRFVLAAAAQAGFSADVAYPKNHDIS
jgi:hypothetical protein